MKQQRLTTATLAASILASCAVATKLYGQTTDPALNALIKKGILTEQEAREAQAKSKAGNEVTMTWKDGLNFQSADGKFKGKLGGRIHLDAASFSEDNDVEDLVGDIPAAAEFRRARLSFEGEFGLNTPLFFKTEYDFAADDTEFKDVYFGFDKVPIIGRITAGHFKEPMGLELLTSSRFLTFIERSAATEAFAPERNIGAMVSGSRFQERITYALGGFADTDSLGRETSIDGNYRVTGRLTGLPWYDEEHKGARLLHVGVSGSYIDSNDDAARFRTRPEAHLAPRLVDTSSAITSVEHSWLGSAEAAALFGPFSAQAEYFRAWVTSGVGSPTYHGFYIYGTWLITGEHRPFRRSTAVFDRVIPHKNFNLTDGGFGAWEVAVRYSHVDLNDEDLDGGRLNDITAGVNWYLHPNAKIQLNYVNAMVDRGPFDGTAHIVQGRFALDF
jgi:phosphate-selective porin OprO/OprP